MPPAHKVFPPGVVNEGPDLEHAGRLSFRLGRAILPYLGIVMSTGSSISGRASTRTTTTAQRTFTECLSLSLGTLLRPHELRGLPSRREAPIAADNHGVFYLNSRIGYDDLVDGPAQTIFAGEITATPSAGWAVGTTATLRTRARPSIGRTPSV